MLKCKFLESKAWSYSLLYIPEHLVLYLYLVSNQLLFISWNNHSSKRKRVSGISPVNQLPPVRMRATQVGTPLVRWGTGSTSTMCLKWEEEARAVHPGLEKTRAQWGLLCPLSPGHQVLPWLMGTSCPFLGFCSEESDHLASFLHFHFLPCKTTRSKYSTACDVYVSTSGMHDLIIKSKILVTGELSLVPYLSILTNLLCFSLSECKCLKAQKKRISQFTAYQHAMGWYLASY